MATLAKTDVKAANEAKALPISGAVQDEAPKAEIFTSPFGKTNELLLGTARSIYQNQIDAFRTQTEAATNLWKPKAQDQNPLDTLSLAIERMHDISERMIASSRQTSDLMRDCNWQLAKLYAESVARLPKQFQSYLPSAWGNHL